MAGQLADVAIIGMAGRFPGARDINQFWQNLAAGVESITHFRTDELEVAHARRLAELPNYVKARGIIEDADKFDAEFFGIHAREAQLIDPQQRIFLECCWHAFEDAGYNPRAFEGITGVYAGCSANSYFLEAVCADREFISEYASGYQVSNLQAMLGANFEFLPTRVAYKLNLRGPAFSLNCGCSTSLVAVCQACMSLQNLQCDMALAGGVSITFPQRRGYLHEPGGIVSPDGHCRTFDEAAQGTVFGDGAAAVLLKRLEDALRDGDHIYAVIKGFGVTNDGAAKVGFTAPGVEGQARAIATAHASAGVDPASISYVEAHGTATPLGDPIEVAALTQAFRRRTQARQFCAIGTAKTNVGHLDVAAGVTGLIKTALSLHHGMLPPILHFTRANPRLRLEESPFFVNRALTPWRRAAVPRRAGVSAFGMGGTNAHVVLEEAPAASAPASARGAHLIVLSARNEEALKQAGLNLGNHLSTGPTAALADVAHTLASGREAFEVRRMVVAGEAGEAAAALSSEPPRTAIGRAGNARGLAAAFMFPGQGAQFSGMGRQLYSAEPHFRKHLDVCFEAAAPSLDFDLRDAMWSSGGLQRDSVCEIDDTRVAQPALFAIEYALARTWMDLGLQPAAMLGHSVGEFVAACLAGVFSLGDALRLVSLRGAMMHGLPRGAMVAVRADGEKVAALMNGRLDLAAVNGPSLVVASGQTGAIEDLERRLDRQGIVHRRLHTSHAFHSRMMEPIVEPFAGLMSNLRLQRPTIPFISGVTGQWIRDEEATDPGYWSRHLRVPVRFSDGVKLLRQGDYALVEAGPGSTLAALAGQHPAEHPDQVIVCSLKRSVADSEERSLLNAAGQLWLHGADLNLASLYQNEKRLRVSLPVYPFERRRVWIDAAPMRQQTDPVEAKEETGGGRTMPAEVQAQTRETAPAPSEQSALERKGQEGSMNDVKSGRRRGQVRDKVRALFEELSGENIFGERESLTFLEMGFDSLFLTQVSQALRATFSVKVTFRQLLDQVSSLDQLVTFIEQQLPPDSPLTDASHKQEPAPEAEIPLPTAPTPPAMANGAGGAEGSLLPPREIDGLKELFTRQLEAMSELVTRQLEALRGPGINHKQAAAERPSEVKAPERVAIAPAPSADAESPGEALRASDRFRVMKSGAGQELTQPQASALRAFIERYNRRTAESKRLTQLHRAGLADPRVASGFRLQWKELVYPIVTVRSKGSKLWDVDGNEYVDLVNGFGPIMFGHAPDFVVEAVQEQLKLGFETGPQSQLAGQVADLIRELTGMERVTFCNTGSEAVTAALRVARTITGRNKIVLFAGAYHGMFDEVLVKGIKGPKGLRSLPVAPGIPREKVENVVVLEYGAADSLNYIENHGHELAAVIAEPVQSRHPALQPVEFLREVRRLTEKSGAALIFDEVVTGFRVHPGGAQALFGIRADLATYGKVLGGGLPIGVLTGKAAFMDALDGGSWSFGDGSFPETAVTFFAGTFVRHPLALAAARAVLNHLKQQGPELQRRLTDKTTQMVEALNQFLAKRQLPIKLESFASIAYFAVPADLHFGSLLFHYLRERGVYIHEGFPLFLTTAHNDADIEKIISSFCESVIEMQRVGFLPSSSRDETASRAGISLNPGRNGSASGPIEDFENPAGSPSEPQAESRRTPLTESQLEIWLSARLSDQASCCYNESVTLKFHGALDQAALRAALDSVVARHQALRATFDPDGPFQTFAAELKIDLPSVDLSALDEAERVRRGRVIIADEARKPFDLLNGPLLRAQVIKQRAAEYHLILTAHHIVCDGWSTNVILSELAELYREHHEGRRAGLPAPLSFEEYARSQQARFGREARKEEQYWVGQFSDVPAPLELPTDRPRPPLKGFSGATCQRRIGADLYGKIKQAGARQKCTLFATLLTGFEALLSRLSGQGEVVVGIPAAGQALLEDKILVGHCVHFLPLRSRFAAGSTVAEQLEHTRQALLDAYEHQDYTYGELIRKLAIRRDPSRLPLMEVQFNLERVGAGMQFGALAAEVEPNAKAFVNQDLFLNVVESNDGLVLDCDYNTDLFDEATIERWLHYYETLLAAAASEVNQPVSRLPLMPESERKRIAVEWNDTESDYPYDLCANRLFEIQAGRTPDAVAAVYENGELTYAGLNRKAERLADYLCGLGIKPGALVGIYVERSLEMLVAMLGVLKSGGAYVPIDPTFPAGRIAFVLEETEATVLLTLQALAGSLPNSRARVVCLDTDWDEIANCPRAAELPPAGRAEDIAYVLYTSGSTGQPKGVEISHRALVNVLCSMAKKPGLSSKDTLLAVTTFSFDIAALELLLPLVVGAKVTIASRQTAADGAQLHNLLGRSQATVLQATPVTFRLLIEAGWKQTPGLRLWCGGEELSRKLATQLLERAESVWNMYGPTETTIWSSVIEVRSGEGAVPLGPPIDNTQFYVLDANKQLAPIGVPGELHIGGAGLARGYLKRPELTADKFIPDPSARDSNRRLYRTGDLVRRRCDGTLEFLGRLDQQVKLRGFRIELGEIETALARYPGVREVVVTLREDMPGEKRLVAYVSTDEEALSVTAVREFLSGRLPNYMLPSAIVRMSAMPVTLSGKIDRRALPAPDALRAGGWQTYSAPRNAREIALAEIWAEVLHLERVGIHDSLFELGADSLHIFQIVARAGKLGMKMNPTQLLKHRTIAELLTEMDRSGQSEDQPAPPRIVRVPRENYRLRRAGS